MSDTDDLEKSLENEVRLYDEFLHNYDENSKLVPGVLRRRKEAITKLTVVRFAPKDALDEISPMLVNLQQYDELRVQTYLPILPEVSKESLQYISGSSGTSSAYSGAAVFISTYKAEQGENIDWLKPIEVAFADLAIEKIRDSTLPKQLEQIYPGLGVIFTTARNSAEAAKAGVGMVDQAAIHMRDVIEQLWGGMVASAKQRAPRSFRNDQHIELKKERHRSLDLKLHCSGSSIRTKTSLGTPKYVRYTPLSV